MVRFVKSAGVVLAVVVALAGCGSSKTSTGPSGGSSSGGSSAGDIPIGVIGTFSGPQAAGSGGIPKVAAAWADTVNAAGGINGHQVKIYLEDDGDNPATGLTEAKELVQKDKVVAFVGEGSDVDGAWASYVQGTGIPVVGGLSLDTPFITSPDFFPTGTNSIALQYGTLAAAKTKGSKLAILYCAEAPQCKQGATLDTAIAPALGVSVSVSLPISASAPDYTAQCSAVKSSGAQSFYVSDASVVALRVLSACAQQGVNIPLLIPDGIISNNFLSTPAANGAIGIDLDAPYFDSSVPATKAYRDALTKYVPGGLGPLDSSIPSYFWAGAQLFQAAVKASGSSTVTAASVKTGLYSLKGETLGGLVQPLTYTQGKPTLLNCYFDYGIANGKFTTPEGLTPQCAPAALVAKVASSL